MIAADVGHGVGSEVPGVPEQLLIPGFPDQRLQQAVIAHVGQDNRMIIGIADRVPVDCDFSRLQTVIKLIAAAADPS